MTAVLKRYRALIRDTHYFEVVIAAHDEDEALALAETFSQEGDLEPHDTCGGDVSVEFLDDCPPDDDRPPAASSELEVAS